MTVSPSPDLPERLRRTEKRNSFYATNRTAPIIESEYDAPINPDGPEAADALESAQAEIARLTTVSGDMVEEMARAMSDALNAGKPSLVQWDRLHREERELYETAAQAAATIAKGRMEAIDGILAEAERLVLDGHPSRALLRVEEARAALKDSPNVG
jgi:hypothetical protein